MSVEFYRGSPGKLDSRTLSRESLSRWTGRRHGWYMIPWMDVLISLVCVDVLFVCICVCVYIYIYIYTYTLHNLSLSISISPSLSLYIYIYIYRERERRVFVCPFLHPFNHMLLLSSLLSCPLLLLHCYITILLCYYYMPRHQPQLPHRGPAGRGGRE